MKTKRIRSLVNFNTFLKSPHNRNKVSGLTVIAGEMVKGTVRKNKFSVLNDKRFYFPDGVVSSPFYHPVVAETDNFKQKRGKKSKNISGRKKELFKMEKKSLRNHPRLYLYHQILTSTPKTFNISQKKKKKKKKISPKK